MTVAAASDTRLVLQADSVMAGYGQRRVLHGVSMALPRGRLMGMLGPNGSGKSTLFHCLTGHHPVEGGAVTIDGTPLAQLSRQQLARVVAFVPQRTQVTFPFTALQMVLMGRHAYSQAFTCDTADDVKIAMAALERLDLAGLADRPFTQLSGGQQQLVILARAMAQQSPILLLDEPLVGLDIRHQYQFLQAVQQLAQSGAHSILASFHELGTACQWCDALVLLAEGRVLAEGAPAEVLTEPNLLAAYGVRSTVRWMPGQRVPVIDVVSAD